MKYRIHSHRHALELLENNESYKADWLVLKKTIEQITEEELIDAFDHFSKHTETKSLSGVINELFRDKLGVSCEWRMESPLFQAATGYTGKSWRLDFTHNKIAVEVAFNHGEAVSWNLLKPNLSGELNHVAKEVQTEIGVIITATQNLKKVGGFDGAVGTYEKFLTYLEPMRHMLTVPMVIIGLEAPETFRIGHTKVDRKNFGHVIRLNEAGLFNETPEESDDSRDDLG